MLTKVEWEPLEWKLKHFNGDVTTGVESYQKKLVAGKTLLQDNLTGEYFWSDKGENVVSDLDNSKYQAYRLNSNNQYVFN